VADLSRRAEVWLVSDFLVVQGPIVTANRVGCGCQRGFPPAASSHNALYRPYAPISRFARNYGGLCRDFRSAPDISKNERASISHETRSFTPETLSLVDETRSFTPETLSLAIETKSSITETLSPAGATKSFIIEAPSPGIATKSFMAGVLSLVTATNSLMIETFCLGRARVSLIHERASLVHIQSSSERARSSNGRVRAPPGRARARVALGRSSPARRPNFSLAPTRPPAIRRASPHRRRGSWLESGRTPRRWATLHPWTSPSFAR
jgi:hypothetical protein